MRIFILNIIFGGSLFMFPLAAQSLIGGYAGWCQPEFQKFAKGTPDYPAEFDSRNSWNAGLTYKTRNISWWGLTLDLDLLKRSSDMTLQYGGRGSTTNLMFTADIYSLNLRVLPELYLGKKFGVYCNAGPYIGVIVQSRQQGTGSWHDINGGDSNWEMSGSAREYFRGVDLGVSASAGLYFPILKQWKVQTTITYILGLNSIAEGVIDGYYRGINARTLSVMAGLLYTLPGYSLIDISLKE